MVKAAIDKGFSALGFSGHGYNPRSCGYCMNDTEGYITEVLRLRDKYRDKIEIYLGVEEEAFAPVDRSRFDYIIGSSHYFIIGGRYLPIDSNADCFAKCLAAFDNDAMKLAKTYYTEFCKYINERKPDIIGHFDLITKFDENSSPKFLGNEEYLRIATEAVASACASGSLFEVNTGAIARGFRTAPYPSEELLRIILKNGSRIILTSDSHATDTIDFAFDETKRYLRDIGFREAYTLSGGKFIDYNL